MGLPQIFQTTISGIAIACAPHVLGRIYGRAKERFKSKNIEQTRLNQLSAFLAFDVHGRDRLIVEQTFRSIFGHLYEYDEVVCLLRSRSPIKAFSTAKWARQFVEFDYIMGCFKFKPAYEFKARRKRLRRIYAIAYGIFAYAALGPWTPSLQAHLSWPSVFGLLFLSVVFGLLAWASISLSTDISAAERFLFAAEPAVVTDSSMQHETRRTDYSRGDQFNIRECTDAVDKA